MNNSKIKICGISNKKILEELINLGLDYVGFIFYKKSPRFASNEFLESIKDINFRDTIPVCVYVNPEENYVYKTSSYFKNPILQFHGDEKLEFCESFDLEYWKAIRVKDKEDVSKAQSFSSATAILFENYKEGHFGGTGESFNLLYVASSSSRAYIRVSGTNLPPYSPKKPSLSGKLKLLDFMVIYFT